MKKLSVIFLGIIAIFCIQNSFSANEPDEVYPLWFAMKLVKHSHPGAWFWFQEMIEKYPQANLKNVQFCSSDCYESGPSTIYFPEFQLKRMDVIFADAIFMVRLMKCLPRLQKMNIFCCMRLSMF